MVDESQLTFKRRLGAGAFGEVYHGRWRGSDVAIKCMFKQGGGLGDAQQKELLDDFRNEVWLLQVRSAWPSSPHSLCSKSPLRR
eukprot:SAG11_NODE_558_length_8540_cov_3.877147_4_plen_84_part_00